MCYIYFISKTKVEIEKIKELKVDRNSFVFYHSFDDAARHIDTEGFVIKCLIESWNLSKLLSDILFQDQPSIKMVVVGAFQVIRFDYGHNKNLLEIKYK